MEVEHVKAHRTEKNKKEILHFKKFVTEDDEKVDELAKGALLDAGFMAPTSKDSQAGARRGVRSLAVCRQFLLSGRRMERLRRAHAATERKIDLRG